MSNLTAQIPVNTTRYDVAVVEKVLDRILEAMESTGWDWDGTLNMVDDFCREAKMMDWWELTPRRKNARKIYIWYIG
ncbi:MAG: hypothetical protein RMX96_13850 [Nostoc sp. ChiSLP02]|nr:hypothetical protein [Nostoc sp. DedSLP05]MDZ8098904.1 hypothetical protein [Nostoc sp. DedSLP01]MDZ8185920.1 hypothetical protein [Nostoc sp. ChiSLP02]